ncbi:MAG: hypothetical protein WAK26_03070 [Terracidiphilus sp.]|jgi:hypothetical protein
MKKTTAPIPLAGSYLGEVRHVCAFFNNDDEEYRVLLPFIKDGFRYQPARANMIRDWPRVGAHRLLIIAFYAKGSSLDKTVGRNSATVG